jgi:hypothetical protein
MLEAGGGWIPSISLAKSIKCPGNGWDVFWVTVPIVRRRLGWEQISGHFGSLGTQQTRNRSPDTIDKYIIPSYPEIFKRGLKYKSIFI